MTINNTAHQRQGETTMKAIPAIKRFFEADPNGRKVTMDELKACTLEERQDLGRLAAEALGEEFEETAA